MKFKVNRASLLEHLNHVSKALAVKTPLPILTCIKCEVSEEGLSLTASDSDITIQTFLPVEVNQTQVLKVEEEGKIALPGKYFIELIKKSNKETLEITSDEKLQVTIKNGRNKYKLNGLDVVNYPNIDFIQSEQKITFDEKTLKKIIHQTSFSAAVNLNRPILTGVQFAFKDDVLECVATDSFRLSKCFIEMDQSIEPISFTIPKKSLVELGKLLKDSTEKVELVIQRNQVAFRFDYMSFQTRLLDGIFPSTKEFVPATFNTEIGVEKSDLYEAVDRASLMSKDQMSNVIRLRSFEDEQKLVIIARSPEIGEIQEELDINIISGVSIDIACSSVYLLDALKAFEGDEIILGYNGTMRPFVINDVEDKEMLQLIVPVRIDA
ncbi:MAG: DNA polymerase III subunit beta [Turicibacter sp.]|nr:DNA polymerase III subunit beta [Turicibacter sp.]